MSVVTGALGSLGPKLLQLFLDEYKLQKGVKKQVQWLFDELNSIYAFLRKVDDVPWDRLDEQVKVWAREVRDASYDMEDVLDTFLVRVDSGGPNLSKLKRAMKKMGKVLSKAKARRDIASAIKVIKEHLKDVAERRQKYKLDEIMSKPVATTLTIDPRLEFMYKEVTQLIGVDKSNDELISMMTPSKPHDGASDNKITKWFSIVGVGGLGKTTLAKAVFDNLRPQYDCGAFVSVGRELDLVKVFKDILFDLDKCKYQNIHNDGRGVNLLIRELREFLENKRYFVVVDDIWDVTTLERIKLALFENNCGSRVITTTRKFDVAKEAGEVYELQPLSYDNSKKLLYARIYGTKRKFHDNQLDDVSRKILKKCDGIPLAIITVASLLACKPKDKWSEVYNSIGFGPNEDNKYVEKTMMIISYSYYDLPSHLRTCLLYLSTYPEDYYIDKDSLIRKWIAEGFVHGEQGSRLFDIGERYFNDLVNRGLIQAEVNWIFMISGCRVHDMVLDLIRKLSIEEKFISLLDDDVEGTFSPSLVRRLAHQNAIEQTMSKAMVVQMPKVRTYTASRCSINNTIQFSRYKLLRVLSMVDCSFKEECHLEHLGILHHLRYLGLSGTNISKLPKQIGDLKLLQTLDVPNIRVLPANIVMLTQLLRLNAAAKVPYGIGKLTFLEELIIKVSWSSDEPEMFVKELGKLTELRVLRVSFHLTTKSMQINFVESLRNLQKIQHIEVDVLHFCEADAAMWERAGFSLPRPLRYFDLPILFSKLPSFFNSSRLPNLSYLILLVKNMDEHDLKCLAGLPALCYLELDINCTVTTRNINSNDGFFQNLRFFKMRDAMVLFEQPNEGDSSVSLHIWNGSDPIPFRCRKSNRSELTPSGVMPKLEWLVFHAHLPALLNVNNGDCSNFGLEYLPSLREVQAIVRCDGMYSAEVDAAEAELRKEFELHPNHPTLQWTAHGVLDWCCTVRGMMPMVANRFHALPYASSWL